MVIKVKWEAFKDEIDGLVSTGNAIVEKHISSKTEDEFDNFKE